jgi:hypothetical protein
MRAALRGAIKLKAGSSEAWHLLGDIYQQAGNATEPG